MPSVYIKTYGCQMNERDSEAVAAQLVAKGYTLAPSEAVADVILLNTCSVRDFAEQKALNKMVNVIAETRRSRPEVVLGFMGCMAQSRGQELIDRLPDVDLVLGTQKFHRAADYLDEILAGRARKNRGRGGGAGQRSDHPRTSALRKCCQQWRRSQTAATGHRVCQHHAGLQPVLHLLHRALHARRGTQPHHSRHRGRVPPAGVAGREGNHAARPDCDELWETGNACERQAKRDAANCRYPVDRAEPLRSPATHKSPFVQLLEAVHEIEGLERIRFTSPHPKGYGDDLIEAYARLPKLVESAHLPVQSGSDRVLKLMHRGYTRARYVGIIEKLRRARPEIGISTDIIVGFPGETEDDFEQTLSLAREVEFDQAYIFKYSQRRDTPAAEMPGQVPQKVREERNQRLLEVINEIAGRRYSAFVGRQMQILVEGPSKKNPARMTGRTRCNKIVVFDGSERHRGQLMDVKITRAGSFTLYGDPAIVE